MRVIGLLAALLVVSSARTQVFDVDTLVYNGSEDSRINIVVLSEGYQSTEFGQFTAHAQALVNTLFATDPYTQYADHFNVFIVKVPSVQSGADHPGTATDQSEPAHPVAMVNTYFGSTFDYNGIHRLLFTTNISAVLSVLATNTPWYDAAVVLVNSPYYGGAGSGSFCAVSAHASSASIFVHELGHSFGNLADEYWAGDGFAGERANMTQQSSPTLVKWANWMGSQGVGIHQHCCTAVATTWYRPHQNCAMRVLGAPFCAVCKQAIVERIHLFTSPVLSYAPASNALAYVAPFTASVNLLAPEPNTLRIRWKVNGQEQATQAPALNINAGMLVPGTNTIRVLIEDTSAFLRVDGHGALHRDSVTWTITNSPTVQMVRPKVFLGGAFQAGAGLMSDALRGSGLIPLVEPYTALGYLHVGGGGGEVVTPSTLAITGPDAIVDWMVVELREPAGVVVASRSALVQRDGDVVAADGSSPITFTVPGASVFRVAIRHRNHLGVMTASPIALGATPTVVDFSLAAMLTYGTNAQELRGGTMALWPGDANRNGVVQYTGDGNDRDLVLQAIGGVVPTNTVTGVYDARDVNLDGTLKYTGELNDRDPILQSVGGVVPTATRVQQLP